MSRNQSKTAPVDANPFSKEPKADKVWDVSYGKETKRVEANTAYYAARKAFPKVHFTEVLVTCLGPAVVKVQTNSLYGVMGSTHPLGDNESCPYCYAYVPEGSQRDLQFRLSSERQRSLAIRVASRIRRELIFDTTWGATTFYELFACSDALAGDQCE